MRVLSWFTKRPAEPAADEVEADAGPVASDRQLVSAGLASRLITITVWVVLACGPLALGMAFATGGGGGAPAAAPARDDGAQVDVRHRVGELATRVVVAWLHATRDDSDELADLAPAEDASFGDDPVAVSDPQVASIRASDESWAVTVAATVGDDGGERRYFQVPIDAGDGDLSVLALPTPVAGIGPGESPRLDYDQSVATSEPIYEAVASFVAAYAAGDGEVARLSSPGAGLQAIEPAPYKDIEVTSLESRSGDDVDTSGDPEDGQTVRVRALAEAEASADHSVTVSYALTLAARDGRWEISAIDDVPAHDVSPSSSGEPDSGEKGKK